MTLRQLFLDLLFALGILIGYYLGAAAEKRQAKRRRGTSVVLSRRSQATGYIRNHLHDHCQQLCKSDRTWHLTVSSKPFNQYFNIVSFVDESLRHEGDGRLSLYNEEILRVIVALTGEDMDHPIILRWRVEGSGPIRDEQPYGDSLEEQDRLIADAKKFMNRYATHLAELTA